MSDTETKPVEKPKRTRKTSATVTTAEKKDTSLRKPKRRRTYYHPNIEPDTTPKDDRVVVLTGASGLLGQEFIKAYATDYKIIAIYNSHEIKQQAKWVDPLFPSFPGVNPHVEAIKCDLSKPDEITELCAYIISQFKKVDVLINAACHRGPWVPLYSEGALEQADLSYAVNVMAPLRLTAGLVQRFWWTEAWEENTSYSRNIINISSTAGHYVYEDSGQGIYSATKAALNIASQHLAAELWEYGLRVNTISPNTFPGIVPTSKVLDQIIEVDRVSIETGRTYIMPDREQVIIE